MSVIILTGKQFSRKGSRSGREREREREETDRQIDGQRHIFCLHLKGYSSKNGHVFVFTHSGKVVFSSDTK